MLNDVKNPTPEIIVLAILDYITDYNWELGVIGGTKLTITKDHKKNHIKLLVEVPRGVEKILYELEYYFKKEIDTRNALDTLKNIYKIVAARKEHHGHTFLNQRAPSTQKFYEDLFTELATILSQETQSNSEDAPNTCGSNACAC